MKTASVIVFGAGLIGAAYAATAVGSDKCTQGPSYWCASSENAKACDVALDDCKQYCENAKEYPDIQDGDVCKPEPVGKDPCLQGPSYWCLSEENAKECDFDPKDCEDYCKNDKEYPDIQDGDICDPPKPGSDKCTRGPSYWCSSTKRAKACEFDPEDCAKYCENAEEYPDIQDGDICKPPLGSNECTNGPSYWCASQANAEECEVEVKDCEKYCENAKEYPDIQDGDICSPPLPGSNKCTSGPSYWCASAENLKECDVKASECQKYCDNEKEYPDIQDGDVCKKLN